VSFADFRLPPGRHGIPAEEVAANQRWRLLGAAAEELLERGYPQTTSTGVARRAAVSPATFYRHFRDVGAVLLASYEAAAAGILERVELACGETEIAWSERVGVAVGTTLRFLAVEPATAHLLGSEAPAGEAAIAAARARFVDRLAPLLVSGRGDAGMIGSGLPAGARERGLIAGALALISDRVEEGQGERLPELGPELSRLLCSVHLEPAPG
jgi:AcrR family transcriptional regulator